MKKSKSNETKKNKNNNNSITQQNINKKEIGLTNNLTLKKKKFYQRSQE